MGKLKRCCQLHLLCIVTGLLFALVLAPSASMAQVEGGITPSTGVASNATISNRAKDQPPQRHQVYWR